MFMHGYGTLQQCWQSCFGDQVSLDPVEQQIVELSTMVGYASRGVGMTEDPNELSNLDDGNLLVVVYCFTGERWDPFGVRSVMDGPQGSLGSTQVVALLGSYVPPLQSLIAEGLWPLYSGRQP